MACSLYVIEMVLQHNNVSCSYVVLWNVRISNPRLHQIMQVYFWLQIKLW